MKPAVIRRSPQLAFMTMNVLTEADTPDTKPDKGLIFLYRLVPGASWLHGGSGAFPPDLLLSTLGCL